MKRLTASSEWQLLQVLGRADRALAVSWWALIAVRGALPAAFALCMGALIAAVQGHHSLVLPLCATGAVFLAMQSGSLHGAVSANLGSRTAAWLHDRLMNGCVQPPGMGHLERADLADDFTLARDFDQGISGPPLSVCMPNIANGFVEVTAGFVQALVLFSYHWWAALLVGGAWVSTHWLLAESSIWRARLDDDVVQQQRHAEYAYRLAVDPAPAKEIRLFGLAGWTVDRLLSRRRLLLDRQWQALKLRERKIRWCLALILGANGAVFWSLAHDAGSGRLSLAALVVFAQTAAGTSMLAFGGFDWWLRTAAQPVPVVLRLAKKMAEHGALTPGSGPAAGLPARELRFQGVRFAYDSSSAPVLDGLDLVVPAGSSLAIVGQNGAGKTTLMKLLCRLYEPQAGAILVDGVDLRRIDVHAWRSRLTAVFQDFVRYELSLRENVAPSGACDDIIADALGAAGADGLAELYTVLSRAYAGGTDLSGGQWQRVALARALCAVRLGAGVVILDEPTAQLDVRGEAEIFERVLAETRGCTTILISHRFSTVRHADMICVIEDGRAVELGAHEELMALGGRYRTMFDLQAARFDRSSEEADDADELEEAESADVAYA